MTSHRSLSSSTGFGIGVAVILALVLSNPTLALESYGFIRMVDGDSDVVQGSSPTSIEARVNQPLLAGDRLRVSPGGRLEAILPDGSLLRLDGNSQLSLARLARSGDTHDDRNLLKLIQGQLQVIVKEDPATPDTYRLDTANATIYLQSLGTYRVFTDGESWTEIVVRDGLAQVLTADDSVTVWEGEQVLVDGTGSPRISTEAAGPRNGFERWGDRLLVEAQSPAAASYVEPSLAYAAAPLRRHGRWYQVGGRAAWRPYVSVGWRPYHAGWWTHTPSGLTWVSTEPWGWVTYHYGQWGHTAGFGWIWYPGHVYTPGAVYWYWGPTHVGWIPAGYYRHHPYRRPGYIGFHGWGGGPVSNWSNWTFCSYRHFGYRNTHSYLHTGSQLQHRGTFKTEVPRGIITTDTRAVTPDLWQQPSRLLDKLAKSSRSRPRQMSSRSYTLPERPSRVAPRGQPSDKASQPFSPSPVRQWNSDRWRRGQLSRPETPSPLRRDVRGVTTRPVTPRPTTPPALSARNQPPVRRVWEGIRSHRHQVRRGIGANNNRRPSSIRAPGHPARGGSGKATSLDEWAVPARRARDRVALPASPTSSPLLGLESAFDAA